MLSSMQEVAIYTLESLTFISISCVFLKCRFIASKRYRLLLPVLFNTVLMLVPGRFIKSYNYFILLSLLICLVTICLFFTGPLSIKLLAVLVFTLYNFSIELVIYAISMGIMHTYWCSESMLKSWRLIELVGAAVKIVPTITLLKHLRNNGINFNELDVDRRNSLELLVLPTIAILCIRAFFKYMESGANISGELMPIAVWILAFNIAILALLNKTLAENMTRREITLLQQQKEMAVSHLVHQANAQAALAAKTHDYANQLNSLRILLEQGEWNFALNHINRLSTNLYSNIYRPRSNNIWVDVVLSAKEAEAKLQNIAFEYHVGDLFQLHMDSEDIVSLISNALDNAIEACQKCALVKRIIRIKLSYIDNLFLCSIINPVCKPVDIRKLQTNKPNKRLHGIGLKSIKAVVEKYAGTYEVFCEKLEFQFTAVVDFQRVAHS